MNREVTIEDIVGQIFELDQERLNRTPVNTGIQAQDYVDVFDLATSGTVFTEEELFGELGAIKGLILPLYERLREGTVAPIWMSDKERKEWVEMCLAFDCNYTRPISGWQNGVRIYAGYFNKGFYVSYYLGLRRYKHQEKWMEDWDKPKFFKAAPRSHGKSEVYSHALPTWTICYQDNVRILLISKNRTQAEKFLFVVKSEFEQNERIIEDFGNMMLGYDPSGELTSMNTKWNSQMFYVRRSRILKDPTMESIGMGKAITGGRFDLIIADDLIEHGDANKRKARDEVYTWFEATIVELLDVGGKVLVIGTRKHEDDLYARLIKNPVWDYSVDKGIIKYPSQYEFISELNEDGFEKVTDVKVYTDDWQVLAPDLWTIEDLLLKKKRTESTPHIFEREIQNNIIPDEWKIFRREWFRFYRLPDDQSMAAQHFIELPDMELLKIYQGSDVAISEEELADYTVVATIGVDRMGNIYVLDYTKDRMPFDDQVNLIKNSWIMWGSEAVGVETVAYQKALMQHLQKNTSVPVVEVPRNVDKVTRAMRIQPYFQNGKVYFRWRGQAEIMENLEFFPEVDHDDIFDALETAIYIAILYTLKPEGQAVKLEMTDKRVRKDLKDKKEKRIGAW